MDRTSGRVAWSLALFVGWLLAFPLHGPLLSALPAAPGITGAGLALTFTLSHAIGLLTIGFIAKERLWGPLMRWGSLGSLLLTATIPFVASGFWLLWMGGLGLAAALFFVGWGHAFASAVTGNRASFMAEPVLVANVLLYGFNLLTRVMPQTAFWLSAVLLLLVFLVCRRIEGAAPAEQADGGGSTAFPLRLMGITCLLVIGLYLNGGFLYSVVAPSFANFARFDAYFGLLPYLAALAAIRLTHARPDVLVYLGPPVLGLGFLAFAWFGVSLMGYVVANTFILASLAAIDVYLWALLGEIGGIYGHSHKVFGLGLACNLMALFAGELIGQRLGGAGATNAMPIGLLAATFIFASMLLVPVLRARVEQDLVKKIHQISTPAEGTTGAAVPPMVELGACLPAADALTERELEITALIIDGHSNASIAQRLHISENTAKVHTKNIYRKLGVSSRHELMSIVIRSYGGGSGQEVAASAVDRMGRP